MSTTQETTLSSGTRPHEIFEHNLTLQDQNEALRREYEKKDKHSSWLFNKSRPRCPACMQGIKPMVNLILISILVVIFIVVFSVLQVKQDKTLETIASAQQTEQTQDIGYELKLNLGSKNGYVDCRGRSLKRSFADFDYALLGYNILKGFPLAVGHDPGFTYPIFKADYSAGYMSSDCRYSVPKGFVVIPDISCITSFSATTIQNKYELHKALSVYTRVSGGGWRAKFSASVGYKRSSSVMSSSEYVYILSTASCNYYFSKLKTDAAPQFDAAFIKWIHKLNNAGTDTRVYFQFFEKYGTHFATEVTFGARYSYEYKMTSRYYESQRKKGVNIRKVAKLKGFFGVGKMRIEFGLSSTQEKRVTEFSENVDTRTITVGAAPPENGSALAWASEVKSDPVPTEYKLSSIEELFTDKYMRNIGVNYNRIRENIINNKLEYCFFLQKSGQIESCEGLVVGIELQNTRLLNHYSEMPAASIADCIDICLEEIICEAVSFCTTCPTNDIDHETCHMITSVNAVKPLLAKKTESTGSQWQSNVFQEKIGTQLKLTNVSVIGVPRGFEREEDKAADLTQCRDLCVQDAYCAVYSYCRCVDQVSKCKMYSKELIVGLQPAPNEDTFFLSGFMNDFGTPNTTASTGK